MVESLSRLGHYDSTHRCDTCEKLRCTVMRSVTEEEKIEATEDFQKHLHIYQEHRTFYSSAIKKSHEVLKTTHRKSVALIHLYIHAQRILLSIIHLFYFAQELQLLYHSRQVCPIYIKTPRKVQLFGVCCDGVPYQVNYLVDEACTIGENGSPGNGANSVISMLHHFFDQHSLGKTKLILHADNCRGQNKNKSVVAYLCWQCIVGLHKEIVYTFMPAGHTRCQVDGFFGLVKPKYRRSNSDTLEHL